MQFDPFIQDSMNFQPPSQSPNIQSVQKLHSSPFQNEEKPENYENNESSDMENQKNYDNVSLSNISSSKKQSSIMAGKKARQKKKVYVESLQKRVNQMQKQIVKYEEDIKKTKETLSKVLQSAKYVTFFDKTKNQNSLTYNQIQACIESQDPNEDRINLLLDMIRFRVGGCGNERQAKVEYFIKQLVNALFPPFQRYLMFCCDKNIDVFQQPSIDQLLDFSITSPDKEPCLEWTRQFLESLALSERQKQELLKMSQAFKTKKEQTLRIMSSLHETKDEIKDQQKNYEIMISQIRNVLRPVQGAAWVLFSDRIRYKREISLDTQKELYNTMVPMYFESHKKVKLD